MTDDTAPAQGETRYAAIGETGTEGPRWYIYKTGYDGNYVGGSIANHASACRIVDELNRLAALRPSNAIEQADQWRHKKRGTTYEVIGEAELQAGQPQHEHACLTIYRGTDGKLWARNSAEFHDGRFEQIRPTAEADDAR